MTTLKQAILDYEKRKKPRNLLGEVAHYKALSNALLFYSVSSTIFLITLLLIK